ncbi:MAG: tetratricopeptide repeat protein [Cyanobacteria bacterium SID2]|nr:tetratricopeptide repeat protein [Cyanobacteria bacterium SID2]MBP0004624.1 tetratricopeptide repeat protein [Cyanobacteria bacterium SBC]
MSLALHAYHRSIQSESENASAYYKLGQWLDRSNKLSAATRAYARAIWLDRDAYPFSILFDRALNFQKINKFELSIECYRELLKMLPQSSRIHYNLGQLYQERGDDRSAILHLLTAIQLNPDNISPRLLYKIADRKAQQGSLKIAVSLLEKLLQYQPNRATTHYNLGLFHHKIGNRQAETRSKLQAFALKPEILRDRDWIQLGIHAYHHLGATVARQFYKTAIDRFPDKLHLQIEYGMMLNALGERNRSQAVFKNVRERLYESVQNNIEFVRAFDRWYRSRSQKVIDEISQLRQTFLNEIAVDPHSTEAQVALLPILHQYEAQLVPPKRPVKTSKIPPLTGMWTSTRDYLNTIDRSS